MRPGHHATARTPALRAYTLTEVLVVCAIIGILGSLLIPAITRGIANGRRSRCAGNTRQLALFFNAFAHDHLDRYPQEIPRSQGGVSEENSRVPVAGGVMAVHPDAFKALAPEFKTHQILVCPTTKIWLNRVQDLVVSNSSYAVNLYPKMGDPGVPLLSDANLATRWQQLRDFPRTNATLDFGFTVDRHAGRCNVAFGDCHVEALKRLKVERPRLRP